MSVRSAALILFTPLLLATAAQASGGAQGSPLVGQPGRPRVAPAASSASRSVSRDFLQTLIGLAARAPSDIIYSHEHVQLARQLGFRVDQLPCPPPEPVAG